MLNKPLDLKFVNIIYLRPEKTAEFFDSCFSPFNCDLHRSSSSVVCNVVKRYRALCPAGNKRKRTLDNVGIFGRKWRTGRSVLTFRPLSTVPAVCLSIKATYINKKAPWNQSKCFLCARTTNRYFVNSWLGLNWRNIIPINKRISTQ